MSVTLVLCLFSFALQYSHGRCTKVSGEGEEKYLIATSEQTLCSMLRHKWIDPKACPMRLAGYSTCFRKEVCTHMLCSGTLD